MTSAAYLEYRPLPLGGKNVVSKLVGRSERLTKDALTPIRNQQPSQYRQQQQPPTISCSAASSPHSSPQNININKPVACTPAKRDLTEQHPSSGYACTACHAGMSATQQWRTQKEESDARQQFVVPTSVSFLLQKICCTARCTARCSTGLLNNKLDAFSNRRVVLLALCWYMAV